METQTEQELAEIRKFLKKWKVDPTQGLEKKIHGDYALWVIRQLGSLIIHFHNAQPWLHYYVAHSLNILSTPLNQEDTNKMVKALKYCFS